MLAIQIIDSRIFVTKASMPVLKTDDVRSCNTLEKCELDRLSSVKPCQCARGIVGVEKRTERQRTTNRLETSN